MSEEQNKEEQLPAAEQTPTPNLKHQTAETMEVHHHGHVHHKKKWKEYLFQFLMLFFAVFCGFLAENQREHYIENKRAKDFARLLIDDLNFDIAELTRATRVLNKIITASDSLAPLLNAPGINWTWWKICTTMNTGPAGDGGLFQEMLLYSN